MSLSLPASFPADLNEEGPPARETRSASPLVHPHVVTAQSPATTSGIFLRKAVDATLLPEGIWTLVGDVNLREIWRREALPEPAGTIWVETSEAGKRLETLLPWLETWATVPLHRDVTILAVGGGVLTDMAGLAASLFLRGVSWHCWPTTLLSQVDAGLGGKTAVNLEAGKNLAGAFHPPARLVICEAFLSTLPARHLASGAWELIKTAVILGDLPWAETLLDAATPPSLDDIEKALQFKAGVVHRDLREQNERKLLNLGHTLGHALEAASSFALYHGEAVGLGLLAAIILAEEHGEPSFPASFIQTLVDRLRPLKDHIPPFCACLPWLIRDKKSLHGTLTHPEKHPSTIHCVLPRPGDSPVCVLLPPESWASPHARMMRLLA